MSLTESTMLELGTQAPDFSLKDVVTGREVSLANYYDKKALLVVFICKHCPYIQHVKEELFRIGRDYKNKSLGIVAISSNDINLYPDDSPLFLKQMAIDMNFNFPVCFDGSQEVAKWFTAACTPDFFLFDKDRKLVYRGQLDDSRPENGLPVTGKDLRDAINKVLSGGKVAAEQKPSSGCNIKWKPGNEPNYFK